jgi:hypothetical protein
MSGFSGVIAHPVLVFEAKGTALGSMPTAVHMAILTAYGDPWASLSGAGTVMRIRGSSRSLGARRRPLCSDDAPVVCPEEVSSVLGVLAWGRFAFAFAATLAHVCCPWVCLVRLLPPLPLAVSVVRPALSWLLARGMLGTGAEFFRA